jgi:hypothetical protein
MSGEEQDRPDRERYRHVVVEMSFDDEGIGHHAAHFASRPHVVALGASAAEAVGNLIIRHAAHLGFRFTYINRS